MRSHRPPRGAATRTRAPAGDAAGRLILLRAPSDGWLSGGIAQAMSEHIAVSGSKDQSIRAWSLHSAVAAPVATLNDTEGRADLVYSVARLSDRLVVSGSASAQVCVWNLRRPSEGAPPVPVAEFEGHSKSVRAVARLGDSRIVRWGAR